MKNSRVYKVLKTTGKILRAVYDQLHEEQGRGEAVPLDENARALREIMNHYTRKNAWFTELAVLQRLEVILEWFETDALYKHLEDIKLPARPLNIGLAYRPDFPLQALEDALSILITGNRLYLLQQQDSDKVMRWLLNLIQAQDNTLNDRINYGGMVFGAMDGYIVWKKDENPGIDEYFANRNALIRPRTASAAVLNGHEQTPALRGLANDMLQLFGLSHHNVHKLYVPEGYSFEALYQILDEYQEVRMHHRFANNHDYHRSLFELGRHQFLDNGFVLFRPSAELFSPIAVIHYETYRSPEMLHSMISGETRVQQWVSDMALPVETVAPGNALKRGFNSFRQNRNAIAWLKSLSTHV